ncbi:MAG: hypothetical protein ACPHF4_08785, partial [Rubripirellula sp.]
MADYWINYQSGSDVTGNGTSGTPYKTIGAVFSNHAQSTPDAYYMGGNQLEPLSTAIHDQMTANGWSPDVGGHNFIGLDGSSTGFDGQGTVAIMGSYNTTGVNFLNLELANGYRASASPLYGAYTGGRVSSFKNCYIHDMENDGSTPAVQGLHISGCRIENLTSSLVGVNADTISNSFIDATSNGQTGAVVTAVKAVKNFVKFQNQTGAIYNISSSALFESNTIYRVSGATQAANVRAVLTLHYGGNRDSGAAFNNLIVLANSVTGDYGISSDNEGCFITDNSFYNVATHLRSTFGTLPQVADPGVNNVTLASNPFASVPTHLYSTWEPDDSVSGIGGRIATQPGNVAYGKVPFYDYVGA